MFRSAAAFAAILALTAGAAGAQEEPIPTAKSATLPDVSHEPAPGPLQPPGQSNLAPVLPGPCGTSPVPKVAPVNADGGPQVDHSPHGEVTVGMGSHGMRYAEGSVCVPVGDNSYVAVDIAGSQFNGHGWRR